LTNLFRAARTLVADLVALRDETRARARWTRSDEHAAPAPQIPRVPRVLSRVHVPTPRLPPDVTHAAHVARTLAAATQHAAASYAGSHGLQIQ